MLLNIDNYSILFIPTEISILLTLLCVLFVSGSCLRVLLKCFFIWFSLDVSGGM
jgi:hypothetical protein